jgi:uncharacterized repeat protein (TIGR01451 family)
LLAVWPFHFYRFQEANMVERTPSLQSDSHNPARDRKHSPTPRSKTIRQRLHPARGIPALKAAALIVLALVLGGLFIPAQAAAPLGGAIIRVNQVTTNSQNETTIAINPTNPRNLVAGSITFQTGTGQCAAYYSMDRGKTWTQQVLPNGGSFPASGDPVVAFDASGTAYFLCMNQFVSGNESRTQYVLKSTDGGQHWSAPVLAVGSPSTDDDKGSLAVDAHPGSPYAGNVYALGTRGPCGQPGELRFARSTNGGLNFEPDQKINDVSPVAFAGDIAVGVDGAVYVSWRDMTVCGPNQKTNGIMIDKSIDGGKTFGALTGGTDHTIRLGDITQSVRPVGGRGGGQPIIGTSPTDPNVVYAVWSEDPAGIDDSDILFARSLDGGNTWSAPIRVNNDVNPPGDFFSQFWPTMAVDPSDGEIDIVWYSDQNDPNRTDGTPLVDVYFASSTDNGASFSPSLRLTPSSSASIGFFGDYIGIDSLGGVAHPLWTDTTFLANNDENIATTQVGGADLRVSVSDAPDPAVAGGSLVYTIHVTNDGPADAFGVNVFDTLPAGVTVQSNTDSCDSGPGPSLWICYLGDGVVKAGETKTFDLTVGINADLVYNAGGPTTITNTVNVTSNQSDPDLSNNTVSEDTLVKAQADAAIASFAAVAPPAEALIGQPVDLTLRTVITNNGPSSPVDTILSGSAASTAGSTVSPASSSETASAVAKNELRTIDEKFTVACNAPGPHTFSFSSTVQLRNPADLDPNPTNNTAATTVTVGCVMPVKIDVEPKIINLKSGGVVPVVVYANQAGEFGLPLAFDPATIEVDSVRFGPQEIVWLDKGGATEAHDKDHGNSARQRMFHFRVDMSSLTPGSQELCIKGKWIDTYGVEQTFFGCDTAMVK